MKKRVVKYHKCPQKHHHLLHYNLRTNEIIDHDTPFVLLDLKKQTFEPWYEWIWNIKNFCLDNYIVSFLTSSSKTLYTILTTHQISVLVIESIFHNAWVCLFSKRKEQFLWKCRPALVLHTMFVSFIAKKLFTWSVDC